MTTTAWQTVLEADLAALHRTDGALRFLARLAWLERRPAAAQRKRYAKCGQAYLAAALGCSVRTVRRYYALCRERGLVRTWRQFSRLADGTLRRRVSWTQLTDRGRAVLRSLGRSVGMGAAAAKKTSKIAEEDSPVRSSLSSSLSASSGEREGKKSGEFATGKPPPRAQAARPAPGGTGRPARGEQTGREDHHPSPPDPLHPDLTQADLDARDAAAAAARARADEERAAAPARAAAARAHAARVRRQAAQLLAAASPQERAALQERRRQWAEEQERQHQGTGREEGEQP